MVRKIFPIGNPSINTDGVHVLILPEGFREQDRQIFYNCCRYLIAKVYSSSLSSGFLNFNKNIHMYCDFIPSSHFGPSAENDTIKGRTFLDSFVDTEKNTIQIKSENLIEYLNSIKDKASFASVIGAYNFLIVILAPPMSPSDTGWERRLKIQFMDTILNSFIVTANGYWEQLVIRAIGELMGLGDEFEHEGGFFLEPDFDCEGLFCFPPNLLYLDESLNAIAIKDTKWKSITNISEQTAMFPLNKPGLEPDLQDNKLPNYNYSPEKIELWECRGNYRTKIYRSAQDCIMRRRIGDKNLPLRKEKLPLCPVCEAVLRQALFSGSGFRTGIMTYPPAKEE